MPGEPGVKYFRYKDEAEFREADFSRFLVPEGTQVLIHAGSGGGWGDPLERDAQKVRWDVIEELVSRESARKHYGVVLKEDLSVDESATRALRARLGAERDARAA